MGVGLRFQFLRMRQLVVDHFGKALFGFGAGVRYLGSSYGDPGNTLKSDAETLFDAIVHYDYRNWKIAVNAKSDASTVLEKL